ncbi:hypothetical protein A0H81_00468 [Grifola frondosa]|uniref:Uncharacterized protein n=1 Tax=Grifola frondosa TaxID=5627 RepID=A0A1C7MSR4_GRIFR|nr:hypothetical protein A0H81_00468 [Grifola frondosa]
MGIIKETHNTSPGDRSTLYDVQRRNHPALPAKPIHGPERAPIIFSDPCGVDRHRDFANETTWAIFVCSRHMTSCTSKLFLVALVYNSPTSNCITSQTILVEELIHNRRLLNTACRVGSMS